MKEVYVKYTKASAVIAQAGKADPRPIRAFVTTRQFAEDSASINDFAASDRVVKGAAKVRNFLLQHVDLSSGEGAAYVCVDVSGSRVEDAKGQDVTPKGRPSKQALLVNFVRGPLIDSSSSWPGDDVC